MRSRRVLAAAGIAAALSGAIVTSPAGATTQPNGNCGGTTLLKPDGSAWVCSFDDEFDGTTLDRSSGCHS